MRIVMRWARFFMVSGVVLGLTLSSLQSCRENAVGFDLGNEISSDRPLPEDGLRDTDCAIVHVTNFVKANVRFKGTHESVVSRGVLKDGYQLYKLVDREGFVIDEVPVESLVPSPVDYGQTFDMFIEYPRDFFPPRARFEAWFRRLQFEFRNSRYEPVTRRETWRDYTTNSCFRIYWYDLFNKRYPPQHLSRSNKKKNEKPQGVHVSGKLVQDLDLKPILAARLRENPDFSKTKISDEDYAQELRRFRKDYSDARNEISNILVKQAAKSEPARSMGLVSATNEIKEILESSNLDGGDGALAKAWKSYLLEINQ